MVSAMMLHTLLPFLPGPVPAAPVAAQPHRRRGRRGDPGPGGAGLHRHRPGSQDGRGS